MQILAKTVVACLLCLATCYPVHSEILRGTATDKIWINGKIIKSWACSEKGCDLNSIIKTKSKIWYCKTDIRFKEEAVNVCSTAKN